MKTIKRIVLGALLLVVLVGVVGWFTLDKEARA